MKKNISMLETNLKKVFNLPKWEIIVPLLVALILSAYTPVSEKKIYKKSISTVVIDAGHGGHDPGCVHDGVKEKEVTLAIALAIGTKLKEQSPDIKIIYTRSGDKFFNLWERAAIANKNNADLFISIHCNSTKNTSVLGTETFAMGLNQSAGNLDVAKRENEVVLLEDDYLTQYEGFDPKSPESHIYFSLFQNAHMEQSIKLAAKVESQLSEKIKRPSRGVKQAGFVVLWKTKMPSILIETGFLSNAKDRTFLTSKEGVNKMSDGVVDAILDYKKTYEAVSSNKIN
jgi:N-acetylmuramoyl-L-alanine amidase